MPQNQACEESRVTGAYSCPVQMPSAEIETWAGATQGSITQNLYSVVCSWDGLSPPSQGRSHPKHWLSTETGRQGFSYQGVDINSKGHTCPVGEKDTFLVGNWAFHFKALKMCTFFDSTTPHVEVI